MTHVLSEETVLGSSFNDQSEDPDIPTISTALSAHLTNLQGGHPRVETFLPFSFILRLKSVHIAFPTARSPVFQLSCTGRRFLFVVCRFKLFVRVWFVSHDSVYLGNRLLSRVCFSTPPRSSALLCLVVCIVFLNGTYGCPFLSFCTASLFIIVLFHIVLA